MSRGRRTNKNSASGRDLWSRRPCSQWSYCKYSRKMTARKERGLDKKLIKEGVEDNGY